MQTATSRQSTSSFVAICVTRKNQDSPSRSSELQWRRSRRSGGQPGSAAQERDGASTMSYPPEYLERAHYTLCNGPEGLPTYETRELSSASKCRRLGP